MKKVVNIGIGGRSFVIDEDAYQKLEYYLEEFKKKSGMGYQTKEVMDDIESRIAEIFTESLSAKQEVVNVQLVDKVIKQLGMPDGSSMHNEEFDSQFEKLPKKLYRDPDFKVFGGVAGGIAAYFDIDLVLIRVLFVVTFFLGSSGFWIYVILWILMPLAKTPTDKCQMRGLPVTAANIRKFSQGYKN